MLRQLQGTMRLIGPLLYGTGLRLGECLDLRVKDLDFDRHSLKIPAARGNSFSSQPWPQVTQLSQSPTRARIRGLKSLWTFADRAKRSDRLRQGFADDGCWRDNEPPRLKPGRWADV